MINFFRKIRENLLAEGKTSKYLKYAVGEIFLVVIGILIALQINNWNESRKDEAFEQEILKQIQENLSNDRLALEGIERNFNSAIESAGVILNTTDSQDIEDSVHILLGKIIQFDRFQPLTNAYEVLKSNGLDKISNKDLRFLLGLYYDDQALHMGKAISDIEIAFNDHWIPILFEETDDFIFKKSVRLKDYRILLKPSKARNILNLNRDNYTSGIKRIQSGLITIKEIQSIINLEIK
jgi:hypothetical protein